jgi:hypothetical protein
MDFPDRLPYEVLDRLFKDTGPGLHGHHEIKPGVVVISSKKSGTFRPFVRLHPLDLIAYQALVDQLASDIETALPPRKFVGAYRQSVGDEDDAFTGSPTNDAFKAGLSNAIHAAGEVFVLQTDISGYFLAIRPERLRHELLEASDRADVVDDLIAVLERWQQLGIRGLPQGVRPSSPLGNVYLASLDRLLGSMPMPFYRWMDDMWAICDSFSEARRVQDRIEQHLYLMGLTLNGEKTRILRAATAIRRLEPARARFEKKRDAAIEAGTVTVAIDDYTEEEVVPDPDEVDRDLTIEEYDRLTGDLEADDLPVNFHGDMGHVLRKLESIKDRHGVVLVPDIVRRSPDLADTAMRYVAAVSEVTPADAIAVFAQVLEKKQFSRDFERLTTCHRALALQAKEGSALAQPLGEIALGDPNPLIRAKALLAWGKHSGGDDTSVAEAFLRSAGPAWRVYAFVAVQEKEPSVRDSVYESWGGSARGLKQVADRLRKSPIKWTKL